MLSALSLYNKESMKSLDTYDRLPQAMTDYVSNYGFHFNKKACEYAVRLMKRVNPATGKSEPIEPITKEQAENILEAQGLKLEHNKLYDFVYIANLCRAKYKKAIPDDTHMAWFIKESIDDPDASEETAFRRWLATLTGNGDPIEWEDLL